jgi:hypothetical protein
VLSDLANYQITVNPCGTTLNPGASCNPQIVCHPTIIGPIGGTMTFVTNASNSPTTAALSCSGVAAASVGIKINGSQKINGVQTIQ